MFKDNLAFIRAAFTEFEHTGALFPTSRWAAQALSQPLQQRNSPKRILELGSGHGAVTVKILEQLIDGDELVVCEINPRLMRVLKARLRRSPLFRKRKSQISFFCGAAQELPADKKFDIIVCAIPFLNFELTVVKDIFRKIREVSARGAVLTYYEFIGIRPISRVISPPKRRRRMRELDSFFKALTTSRAVKREHVWLNMLPINIYKVQISEMPAAH